MLDELTAVRFAFSEALRRMSEEQADQFETWLFEMVASLRDHPNLSSQTEFIDGLEFIALTHRHRHDFVEGTETDLDKAKTPEHVIICLQCEIFPIELGEPCPECRTSRWLHVTRI